MKVILILSAVMTIGTTVNADTLYKGKTSSGESCEVLITESNAEGIFTLKLSVNAGSSISEARPFFLSDRNLDSKKTLRNGLIKNKYSSCGSNDFTSTCYYFELNEADEALKSINIKIKEKVHLIPFSSTDRYTCKNLEIAQ